MVPDNQLDTTTHPIDVLDSTLGSAWDVLCECYDLDLALPGTQTLFTGAAINTPPKAAESVLINMLIEIIENIGRYSSWYKQSARAFGLISLIDPVTGQSRWLLAPEALQKWQTELKNLTHAIQLNNGLIQATLLIENYPEEDEEAAQVIALCECFPPKRIQIDSSILDKTAIICDECQQVFQETI
jgi:hypothetical protein